MEQTEDDKLLQHRIIYVEPNDVYDKETGNKQGDLSLTPRYEDFCISFNLIIEQFQRNKSAGTISDKNNRTDDEGRPRVYVIQWNLTQEDLIKRRTSVLQGNKGEIKINPIDGQPEFPYGDKYNYLTTYYQDLTYDSYGNKTEIEGLGVESVQISYESWYTPTITIKFVDVRGSAIFGREEAIHVDSQLMAENVFGAFFSMPYPLFRLQVKGFFGKPVTYQLACSGFKGELNANTGNFEAVATFIGYSWSLLTDIPFAYLVAAPYATYIGSDYWQLKKNSKEWGLWNDTQGISSLQPPKLYDLFKQIKNVIKTEEFGQPNETQKEELAQMGSEMTLLNELTDKRLAFLNSLKDEVGGGESKDSFIEMFDNETKNTQLLLFYNSPTLELKNETKTKYEEFYNSLKSYEMANYKNGCEISTNKAPNKWVQKDKEDESKIGIPDSLTFFDIFDVQKDNNGNTTNILVKTITNNQNIENELTTIVLNENDGKIGNTVAKQLSENIKNNANNIKQYCYLIDLYDIPQQIKDRKDTINKREGDITKEINESVNKGIIDILGGINNGGFKPFIGNVFKIIFCHLETFCHIMFDSANEIYDQMHTGKRKPEQLGITMEQTDIKLGSMENVTPWPALFNHGIDTSECGYKSDIDNVYAWVGDISSKHAFIEEKVVYALQEGIQMITAEEGLNNSDKALKIAAFPILPSDYLKGGVFSNVTIGNITELAGHLGDRIGAIFGVMCNSNIDDEMATIFGKLDAYNLFSRMGSIVPFGNATKDIDVDLMEGIMYCKQDKKYADYATLGSENTPFKKYSFETAVKIDEKFTPYQHTDTLSRHPYFFDENNDTQRSLYVHYYDKNYINYVPSTIKSFESYKLKEGSNTGDFKFNLSPKEQNFIPNISKTDDGLTTSHDWLHICESKKIGVLKDEGVDIERYTNKQMFNIITDTASINGIRNKCNELRTGNINVMGYEVKDDLNGFVDKFLGADNKFYSQYFSGVTTMLSGNSTKMGLSENDFLSENTDVKPKNFNWTWYEDVNGKRKNVVKIDENCDFTWNDEKTTLSDLVIQGLYIFYLERACDIFGCPFYYYQNKRYKNEDDALYSNRILRSKAYLFLHTFMYSEKICKSFDKNKTNGSIQLVPKALLLLHGALLWRKRFIKKNGYDPILAENGVFIPDENHTFITKKDIEGKSGVNIPCVFEKNKTEYADNGTFYSLDEYGILDIDYNYENQLIDLFEKFAVNTFDGITKKYELKKDGQTISYEDLKKFIEEYSIRINERTQNDKSPNPSKTPEKTYQQVFDTVKQLRENFNTYKGICAITTVVIENVHKIGLYLLYNEKNKEDQNLFKDLYYGSYAIVDNCYRRLTKGNQIQITDNDKIYVKKSSIKSYLKGFTDASKDIMNTQTVTIGEDTNLNVSSNTFKNRDLSLAIYYYLKNLWDKWLVIAPTDAFDVKNFFDENFVFIDSFYKNTYNLLAINCEELLSAWNQLADNGSLFHFISQIVSKHGCIFLPVPDYIGFSGKGTKDDDKHDVEMMKDLFRPIPYNAIEAPSNSNKFIVMYTHSPAHVVTEQNSYVLDSYDIWSHKDGRISDDAAILFKKEDTKTNNITRLGYNVPSFGVAFAKQNNHIFKNLRLTMDNPVMTEQAIKAQWSIAVTGGSSEAHSIHFIGQDTFNVFSNYSYSITIDMMGNAQICPLMYFQLLNVPLWKGTYMIYKVVHNMTPGDMVTTITAMKMSKFAQPFNSTFFTMHKIKKAELNGNGTNSDCDETTNSGGSGPSISGGKVTNPRNVNIKDPNAYNIVLWRYNKDKNYWPGSHGANGGHSIEGVIYEYGSNDILAWTIQSDSYDLVGGKKEYYVVEPGGNKWVLDAKENSYREGCSYYCAKISGGRKSFGLLKEPGSMLRVQLSDKGTGGCLFHPGKNAGGGWTEGCVLTGEKSVNGSRPNFNTAEYNKNKIDGTSNPDVIWWKNFYNKVVAAICNDKKVHMYVKTEYTSLQYDGGVVQSSNNTPTGKPTGNLVNIVDSLPEELKPYVKIDAIYAKSGGWENFGNRCMPGYVSGQNYLWIGKKTMSKFIEAVRYLKEHHSDKILIIWDAYRPLSAAKEFVKIYEEANGSKKNCNDGKYVDGSNGGTTFIARNATSPHCKGVALDLTLGDKNTGKPLPMINNASSACKCKWARNSYGFDEFSDLGNGNNKANVNLLNTIMSAGGKNTYTKAKGEFWHFQYYSKTQAETDGSQNYG